jgi:hypothetical protein
MAGMKLLQNRIALVFIALCGGALLYVARSGMLTEKPYILGATSVAAVMIGGGIGGLFKWPIVGAAVGLSLYALYIFQCAMLHCAPS